MSADRLFTRRFFVMCAFTFTVFLSLFQLLPTAPFRILELGGSTTAAGLFLGLLTYASALSAPLTGALADRIGRRRMLLVSSVAIALFSLDLRPGLSRLVFGVENLLKRYFAQSRRTTKRYFLEMQDEVVRFSG